MHHVWADLPAGFPSAAKQQRYIDKLEQGRKTPDGHVNCPDEVEWGWTDGSASLTGCGIYLYSGYVQEQPAMSKTSAIQLHAMQGRNSGKTYLSMGDRVRACWQKLHQMSSSVPETARETARPALKLACSASKSKRLKTAGTEGIDASPSSATPLRSHQLPSTGTETDFEGKLRPNTHALKTGIIYSKGTPNELHTSPLESKLPS